MTRRQPAIQHEGLTRAGDTPGVPYLTHDFVMVSLAGLLQATIVNVSGRPGDVLERSARISSAWLLPRVEPLGLRTLIQT